LRRRSLVRRRLVIRQIRSIRSISFVKIAAATATAFLSRSTRPRPRRQTEDAHEFVLATAHEVPVAGRVIVLAKPH